MNQDEVVLKLIDKINLNNVTYSKLERYYNGDPDILREKGKSDLNRLHLTGQKN